MKRRRLCGKQPAPILYHHIVRREAPILDTSGLADAAIVEAESAPVAVDPIVDSLPASAAETRFFDPAAPRGLQLFPKLIERLNNNPTLEDELPSQTADRPNVHTVARLAGFDDSDASCISEQYYDCTSEEEFLECDNA